MKKLLCLFLVFMMIAPCAFADTDYSKMSDSELLKIINEARNELNKRITIAGKNKYLVQNNDFEIYFTGNGSYGNWGSDKYFDIEIVVVNKKDQTLNIQFDGITINGWETETLGNQIKGIGPMKKKKDSIKLLYTQADLESYKDMEDIEVAFHTFNEDYRKIKDYGPFVFDFDGKAWN